MHEERDGSGGGYDGVDGGYYEKKAARNAQVIELWISPLEKAMRWLKGREPWLGLPRWIFVWLGLSMIGTFVASWMDYFPASIYFSLLFVVGGMVYMYLMFTRR